MNVSLGLRYDGSLFTQHRSHMQNLLQTLAFQQSPSVGPEECRREGSGTLNYSHPGEDFSSSWQMHRFSFIPSRLNLLVRRL